MQTAQRKFGTSVATVKPASGSTVPLRYYVNARVFEFLAARQDKSCTFKYTAAAKDDQGRRMAHMWIGRGADLLVDCLVIADSLEATDNRLDSFPQHHRKIATAAESLQSVEDSALNLEGNTADADEETAGTCAASTSTAAADDTEAPIYELVEGDMLTVSHDLLRAQLAEAHTRASTTGEGANYEPLKDVAAGLEVLTRLQGVLTKYTAPKTYATIYQDERDKYHKRDKSLLGYNARLIAACDAGTQAVWRTTSWRLGPDVKAREADGLKNIRNECTLHDQSGAVVCGPLVVHWWQPADRLVPQKDRASYFGLKTGVHPALMFDAFILAATGKTPHKLALLAAAHYLKVAGF